MDYERAFPSKFMKASDLDEKGLTVAIASVGMENIGDDHRLIVKFKNHEKVLVCNKTNAKRIARMHGRNTDAWIGKQIVLDPAEVDFKGETVPAIRVREAKTVLEFDDEVPFDVGQIVSPAKPVGGKRMKATETSLPTSDPAPLPTPDEPAANASDTQVGGGLSLLDMAREAARHGSKFYINYFRDLRSLTELQQITKIRAELNKLMEEADAILEGEGD